MPKIITNPVELSAAQERILKVLGDLEQGANLDGHSLAEEANVADTWITGFTFKSGKANRTKALCEQGLVKAKDVETDGLSQRRYAITAKGRRELAKIIKREQGFVVKIGDGFHIADDQEPTTDEAAALRHATIEEAREAANHVRQTWCLEPGVKVAACPCSQPAR